MEPRIFSGLHSHYEALFIPATVFLKGLFLNINGLSTFKITFRAGNYSINGNSAVNDGRQAFVRAGDALYTFDSIFSRGVISATDTLKDCKDQNQINTPYCELRKVFKVC